MPPMLYPNPYVWMLFFSTMDVILTALILRYGGEPSGPHRVDADLEINPVARLVIESWGMPGASAFKFALVMLVVVLCEVIGRKQPGTGRRLAWLAVVISAFPVVWSLLLLFSHRMTFFRQAHDPIVMLAMGVVADACRALGIG
jgi:hypothetical protein